ncbi:MAG: NAD(P)-dependent oxidoreductase [Symbiobacterium sp.]|uniref:NAD-dependent epimerase/dehydratase family protein n=1 Tax=Symbiobacterium sp. TaxID=1971213 RepID=UPI0034641536
MRILVTGSAGRVGRHLVRELQNLGHEVIGFDAKPLQPEQVDCKYVQGALEDPEAVACAAEGVQAVIHIGALMSWVPSDARRLFAANVAGTFNLLEAVAPLGLTRFIFASSGEVYPEGNPVYLPVDEHHPTKPTSHYGMTKLLGEQMVWFYARKYRMPTVVLRFPHTQDATELLDPTSFFSGPRFFLRSKIRQQRMFGNTAALAVLEPLDDGTEKLLLSRGSDGTPYRMGIADTRDVVQGVIKALDSERALGETIALGPDEPVRFDQALPRMAELTGLPLVEARLPGNAVNYNTSNFKAKELLDFRPRWTFDAMLEEAAAAYRARVSHHE